MLSTKPAYPESLRECVLQNRLGSPADSLSNLRPPRVCSAVCSGTGWGRKGVSAKGGNRENAVQCWAVFLPHGHLQQRSWRALLSGLGLSLQIWASKEARKRSSQPRVSAQAAAAASLGPYLPLPPDWPGWQWPHRGPADWPHALQDLGRHSWAAVHGVCWVTDWHLVDFHFCGRGWGGLGYVHYKLQVQIKLVFFPFPALSHITDWNLDPMLAVFPWKPLPRLGPWTLHFGRPAPALSPQHEKTLWAELGTLSRECDMQTWAEEHTGPRCFLWISCIFLPFPHSGLCVWVALLSVVGS